MKNRSFNIFIIALLSFGILFFILNFYLPSKLEATNPRVNQLKSSQILREAPKEEVVKESIAISLNIPEPKTVTLTKFNGENIKKQKKKTRKIFEIPKGIEAEVNFWKNIYTKYDKTKVVFHDKKHMGIVYSIMDLKDVVDNPKYTKEEQWSIKKERVQNELTRITNILNTLDEKDPTTLNKQERHIYNLFSNINEPNKFKKATGRERLRSQTGIKEKFLKGISISGRYLGEIEKIFASHGVPLEISRLAFVESMFNLEALSKVGASGIWQFMPSTGKLFLDINDIVDERNDPITATHAAAKLLRKNYDALRSWPLAINAYNSGRLRMVKAVNQLGTKDISTIIKKFKSSGYKFASRNFYPAFLAALHSFEDRERIFGKIEMEEPLQYDIVHIPFFTSLPELIEYTGTSKDKFLMLNPHFQEEVLMGELPIPRGFQLKVPTAHGEDFLVAINEMDKVNKYAKWHIVEPGENLKVIASKYNTNSTKIKKVNGLRKNHVKAGQILKLPKNITLAKEKK